jgi:hypothetical protein
MTCNFFTIVRSYFRCCCCCKPNTTEKKNDDDDRYQVKPGDNSPYTFEDLSAITDESSEWSSSSTLDEIDEKTKQYLKETFHRNKLYQRKLFHPYEEDQH